MELALPGEELGSMVYINRIPEADVEDFLWDWSSSPISMCSYNSPVSLSLPPSRHPRVKHRLGDIQEMERKEDGFSSATVTSLLISNLVSLVLGAGLGVWLYRTTTRGQDSGLRIVFA